MNKILKDRRLLFGLHTTWFIIYAYSAYYFVKFIHPPGQSEPPRNYAGKWKFLTFWDLVLQLLFYAVCAACDVISNRRLHRFKDSFFAIFAFPLAFVVFSTFWGIYAIDRNLVYPPIYDKICPRWLNHAAHTLIVPTSLLELYLQPHVYPSRKTTIGTTIFFASLYIFWVIHIAYVTGFWVYPVLEKLGFIQRGVFFVFAILLYVTLVLAGEKLNSKLWGNAAATTEKIKSKQKKSKKNRE